MEYFLRIFYFKNYLFKIKYVNFQYFSSHIFIKKKKKLFEILIDYPELLVSIFPLKVYIENSQT
jgi:hypothetical protein